MNKDEFENNNFEQKLIEGEVDYDADFESLTPDEIKHFKIEWRMYN